MRRIHASLPALRRFAFIVLINSSAHADLPRPPKPNPQQDQPAADKTDSRLIITIDNDAKAAHLSGCRAA